MTKEKVTSVSKELYEPLDAAKIDPRQKWKETIDQIEQRELEHVPEEVAKDLVRSRKPELVQHLVECFEDVRFPEARRLIGNFELSLRDAVMFERRNGRLRPVTPVSEIERVTTALRENGYRAIEIDALGSVLKPGEKIVEVGVRTIRTSERTVARAELINVLKSITHTRRDGNWESQFPTDAELREIEQAIVARQNARPPWHDSRNTDLR